MNRIYNTLIILFLIVCLSIPAIATTSSPAYPMILSGDVIINGVDAPAGTIIEAREGDKLLGATTVQVDGEYGNTIFNKLLVTKPDGASFDLYIQLPTMSSSIQVASVIWGSRDETFNIDIGTGDTGTSDAGTGIATTSSPAYPMILSGEVIINGVDAPAGTIIEAREGDKLLGTTTVQVDGEYGNTIFNKLLVTKPDGASFDLYIQLPTMSSSIQVASVIWGSRDETFNIDIGTDDTGTGDAGTGDTGTGDTGTGDAGTGDTGTGDTGTGDTGTGDTGTGDTGAGDTGAGDTGTDDTGTDDTGTGDTGTGDTGTGDTGAGDTGTGDTGTGDAGTGRTSRGSGGGGMGSVAITTKSKIPSVVETTSLSASTNTKEDTNTNEPTATQSLKDGIEDTVFQTRDAAKDNTILSSILIIGFIAMLLLGYMRYNKT